MLCSDKLISFYPFSLRPFIHLAGSDIIKDDGVYAAYVLATDLKGNGRYNVKIEAKSKDGDTKVVMGGSGMASGALEVTGSGEHHVARYMTRCTR